MLASFCIAFAFVHSIALPNQSPAAGVVAIDEHSLTFNLGFLQELGADAAASTGKEKVWNGTYEGSHVAVRFATIDMGKTRFHEPEDAVESIRDEVIDQVDNFEFAFEPVRAVRGTFGVAPILAITRSEVVEPAGSAVGETWLLGGLLADAGWYLRVDLGPTLAGEPRAKFSKLLEACAQWKGTPRDPRWTDAEAKAYFDARSPADARKKYQKPIRTEHFIVLSPHSSANQYGKKLEAWYGEIKKSLPLEEAKDRRLLPVLLYRHDEEFKQFYADVYNEKSRVDVEFESWCGGDWFATHFDNDDEYDNRVELTKFLLINRLRAWSACQWFRSGLREYCATRANERSDAVRAARKGRGTPLEKLLDDKAWGDRRRRVEKTGADQEVDYWEQSAVWMEFLREGKETKAKFGTFVLAMSGIARGDIERVQVELKRVYGWDMPELQKRWAEYCQGRK